MPRLSRSPWLLPAVLVALLAGCAADDPTRLELNVYLSNSFTGRTLPPEAKGFRIVAFQRYGENTYRQLWEQAFYNLGGGFGSGPIALDPNRVRGADEPLIYIAEAFAFDPSSTAGNEVVAQAVAPGVLWTGGERVRVNLMLGASARFNLLTGADQRPVLLPEGGLMGHTATVLPARDASSPSRVLIAGGRTQTWRREAFEYDPTAMSYDRVAEMPIPRAHHTATLYNAAAAGEPPVWRVLIVGGATRGSTTDWGDLVTDAAIYDATSRTWRAIVTPAGMARVRHTATLLADGRVLITGGLSKDGENIVTKGDSWTFDPTSEQFMPSGSLAHPRLGHSATLLSDGSVVIIGGHEQLAGDERTIGYIEIWNNGAFTPGFHGDRELTALARTGHTALHLVAASDGQTHERIAVLGGYNSREVATFSTRILIVDTNGRLLGAEDEQGNRTEDECNVLTMFGGTSEGGRRDMVAVEYRLNDVDFPQPVFLLLGGRKGRIPMPEAMLVSFDPAFKNPQGAARPFCRTTSTRVYNTPRAETPFPPNLDASTERVNLQFARWHHTAVNMGNGQILVTGGTGSSEINGQVLVSDSASQSSELFVIPSPNDSQLVFAPF